MKIPNILTIGRILVAPVLNSIYDNWYYDLSGSKVAYINGEISGSRINI